MSNPPAQHLRKFRFNTPQRIAALLLLIFAAQCLLVIGSTPATMQDAHYAVCGSRIWGAPSASTRAVCPKFSNGILAYRAAGLPLAIHHWLAGHSVKAAPINTAHTLDGLLFWLRLPFLLAGLALGGCLWWVTRRLFGNPGGYVALGFYCFSPPVIAHSAIPNNGILAAFGLFAAIYTAIGVAHAMQGPRRKWRKRIILLAVTLGFTAAASVLAFLLSLVIGTALLVWLAEDRRRYVPRLTLRWTVVALLIFFAAYGFRPDAFRLFLHPAFATSAFHHLLQPMLGWNTAPAALALAIALIGYVALRRSRYFGNTTPLWIAAILILLAITHIHASCGLWTVPFLLTFLGGVYADLLESRLRKPFFALCAALLAAQAYLSLSTLNSLILK